MEIEEARAFRRIGELGAEGGVVPPAFAPFDVEIEVGVEEDVQRALGAVKKAAAQEPKTATNGNISPANTMPHIINAVRAYATVGEICEALREVYGTYTEVSVT